MKTLVREMEALEWSWSQRIGREKGVIQNDGV